MKLLQLFNKSVKLQQRLSQKAQNYFATQNKLTPKITSKLILNPQHLQQQQLDNIQQKNQKILYKKQQEKEIKRIPIPCIRSKERKRTQFNLKPQKQFSNTEKSQDQPKSFDFQYMNKNDISLSHRPDSKFENKFRDYQYKRPKENTKVLQFIYENEQVKHEFQTKYYLKIKNTQEVGIDQKLIQNLQEKQIGVVDEDYGLKNNSSKEWPKRLITPTMCLYIKDKYSDIKDNNIYYPEKSDQESIYHSIRDFTLYQEISMQDDILDKINFLLSIDDLFLLLDTRRITSLPKQKMRPLYNMWHARMNSQIKENPFNGEKFTVPKEGGNYIVDEQLKKESKCHFDHINKVFEKGGFSVPRHKPYIVDKISDIDTFQQPIDSKYLHQDMAIKFPGTEYRIPKELESISKEFTEKVANFFKSQSKYHDQMYAYLTVSRGPCEPFLAQRRPGMHADGFKSYLTHEDGEINDTVFIATNAVCPVFYNESFPTDNLDAGKDDFWCNFSSQCKEPYFDGLRPYQIAMVDGFNLHSVAINKSFKTFDRIFIRIMYSVSQYNRMGNLKNPLFDYDWDMKPQPIQMPPVFWQERQKEYQDKKIGQFYNSTDLDKMKLNLKDDEKIIFYSDGLWSKVKKSQ